MSSQQRSTLTPPPSPEKCPSGWHHYEKTASCYKVYLRSENYWQAVETCQKVNGSLATFVTNEELQFILKIEVDFDDKVCDRRDQCKSVSGGGGVGRRIPLCWLALPVNPHV